MLKRVRSPTRPTSAATPPSLATKEAVLVRGCVKSTHSTISSESRCQAHSLIRGSRWLLRVFSGWLRFGWSALARPSAYVSLRSLGSTSYNLRLLVGLCTMAEPCSVAFAARRRWLHCALNRRTDSRGVANGSRCCEWVESFGVANGATLDLLSRFLFLSD